MPAIRLSAVPMSTPRDISALLASPARLAQCPSSGTTSNAASNVAIASCSRFPLAPAHSSNVVIDVVTRRPAARGLVAAARQETARARGPTSSPWYGRRAMYEILLYDYVEGFLELRAPYRQQHLALARAFADHGHLVMAGAYAEPTDGAVLVFRSDEPGRARAFAEQDPYVENGLVTKWRARKWNVVIGTE
jgi:uncharacterized protein YciI